MYIIFNGKEEEICVETKTLKILNCAQCKDWESNVVQERECILFQSSPFGTCLYVFSFSTTP